MASSLIPLILLVLLICVVAVIGFVAYSIAQGVGQTTREKMEKKHMVFGKDGMKVGVKEVSDEDMRDRSQSALVNVWNHSSFPAYKSRLWNMAGASDDQGSMGKRKSRSK